MGLKGKYTNAFIECWFSYYEVLINQNEMFNIVQICTCIRKLYSFTFCPSQVPEYFASVYLCAQMLLMVLMVLYWVLTNASCGLSPRLMKFLKKAQNLEIN